MKLAGDILAFFMEFLDEVRLNKKVLDIYIFMCYTLFTIKEKEKDTMVALMRYECGLKFTGLVFENMDTVQKWLKENGWVNPRAYEIIPVAFYTKDGEVK